MKLIGFSIYKYQETLYLLGFVWKGGIWMSGERSGLATRHDTQNWLCAAVEEEPAGSDL